MAGSNWRHRLPQMWSETWWIVNQDDGQGEDILSGDALMSANDELLKEERDNAVKALRNLDACMRRMLPTPYHHDCEWCSACVNRAKRVAKEVLARHA